MKTVEIYTDGACSGNPGPGGWATILIHGEKIKEISGFERETTNNRMELLAVIKGLQALKQPCKVNLHSDSSYVVNAFNDNWIAGWKKKAKTDLDGKMIWYNSQNKPVLNQDLWEELLKAMDAHMITYIKVKGHSDNFYNNRCDALAVAEISRCREYDVM
ncbi:MAG: ribonuclease HI [Firmicutes bacterium]|nr:ribonuclease HI [Bacillota bacterium]